MERSRTQRVKKFIIAFVLSVILVAVAADGDISKLSESEKTSIVPSRLDEGLQLTTGGGASEPLLVTTLDGRVAAVDKETGETLWSFDTEHALISAKGSAGYAFNVVPGVQGELYTQPRGGNSGFQMLPETLPEWVEKTPFVMSDGSLWLGSRHTHAFYVDPATGSLVKSVVEYGESGFQDNIDSIALPEGRRPILLGRVDYRVRAIHQDSGVELFNVSYSQLSLLDSSLKLPTFGATHALDAGSEAAQLNISLDPGRKNAIRRVDGRTGEELWSVGFDQPPITVFAGGEVGMSLYQAPAWPAADGIAARLGVGRRRQASIMVESIRGHPYALPMVTTQQQTALVELMPPEGPSLVRQEAEQCSMQDTATPPATDEVVDVAAAQNPDDSNLSSWGDVLGMHYLDTTPSLFVSERVPSAMKDQDSKGLLFGTGVGILGDMGLMSMSSVAGAGLVAFLAFAWINQSPRVIASLKNKGEGVRKLTLSYTGTTAEAEAARKKGKELEQDSPTTEKSRIRDWTGSGTEHIPEQEESGGTRSPKHPEAKGEAPGKPTDEEQEAGTPEEVGTSGRDSTGKAGSDESHPSRSSNKRRRKRRAAAAAAPGAEESPFGEKAGEGFETSSSSRSGGESSSSEDASGKEDHAEAGTSGRGAGLDSDQDPSDREAAEHHRRGKESGSGNSSPGSRGPTENGRSSKGAAADNGSSESDPSSRQNPHLRRSEWRDGVTYVGRLAIGPGIVGYGSSGTLVFEGSLDGRQVAVKRVLRQFYELARKEIGALIVADEHPNVVRCFAMEEDTEFVYLALERCKQSLNDVLGGGNPKESCRFVDGDGMPTQLCMRVCEEVGRGLLALHERSIVHRDLKPHNVLFTEAMRTKLSDMGLCKRLTTDQTSYDSAGPGGSTGWQAPEQLILRSGGEARQGRSVDIFTFGLLLFYCLSGGQHPFGEGVERDYRILNGRMDLGPLSRLPEAVNMIRAMLRPQPKQRPSVAAIMAHPFWWDPSRKLNFLVDLSNRLENEDREVDRSLLRSLESCAEEAIGGPSWAAKLDPEFLANLGRYRKYNPSSLRDLLRVIRNKHNHFREMPEGLQERVGRTPEAFVAFFAKRFPQLLLTAYSFALSHCSQEPLLQKYFPISAKDFPFASAAVAARLAQKKEEVPQAPPMLKGSDDRTKSAPSAWKREPPLATVDELRETTQRAKSDTNLLPPPPPLPKTGRFLPQVGNTIQRGWWSPSDSPSSTASQSSTSSTSSSAPLPPHMGHPGFPDMDQARRYNLQLTAWGPRDAQPRRPPMLGLPPKGGSGPLTVTAASLPLRESAVNLLSAPPDAEGSLAVEDALAFARAAGEVPPSLKVIQDSEGHVTVFPQRPGGAAPDCDFFCKTGSCKFGANCHFHHPLAYSVKLTNGGDHPIRPDQPVCPFYDRTGQCKFGPACKFHHPPTPACMGSQAGGSQPAGSSGRSDTRTSTSTVTSSTHSSED